MIQGSAAIVLTLTGQSVHPNDWQQLGGEIAIGSDRNGS
jgi:hypothetical protein